MPKKQTASVWKPRCLMQNIARAGAVPNINDQDVFPTFEAAEKIEKLKKDDEKKRFFFLPLNFGLVKRIFWWM